MHLTTHLLLLSLAPLGGAPATSNGGAPAPAGVPVPPGAAAGPTLHWGDYDRDGALDVFVATPAGADRLFRSDAGQLVDVTRFAGLEPSKGSRSATWFDYDQDGDLDLFTASDRAPSRLWSNDGAGAFVDVTAEAGLAGDTPDRFVLTLDFDGDGWIDLQRRTAAGDRLFRNLGDGRFVELPLAELLPGVVLGGGASLDAPDRARRAAGAAGADAAGAGGGSQASTAGPGAGGLGVGATSAGGQQAVGAALVCAGSVEDMANPGTCVPLSTVPTLGMIYPLGLDLNIDGAGQVGMGTTTPGAKLDVLGDIRSSGQIVSTEVALAPFSVASTQRVDNLNADLLDGLSASAFTQLGQSISGSEIEDGTITAADLATNSVGADELASNSVTSLEIFPDTITAVDIATGGVLSAEIQDGTILDVDVNPLAAIAGTKIAADFGSQQVTANGSSTFAGVKGVGSNGPTNGYLGVQGTADFDGLGPAWSGWEIGVAAISDGASQTDNYAFAGHSSHVGVHAEGDYRGVQGIATQDQGSGVWGINTSSSGQATGVKGEIPGTDYSGTGVHGEAPFCGVLGTVKNSGVGVAGIADGTNGIGLYGRGVEGILGDSQMATGIGVGVRGFAISTSARAVVGHAVSTTGVTHGVYGDVQSSSGRAVYGIADSLTGVTYGVLGQTESTSGRGVRGESLSTTGTTYGVQGRVHSPNGWGVISYGSSGATGQKNFIQPHPTDPSREIHFFSLEGNESGTYFRGSDVLSEGSLVIEVPQEFRDVSSPEGLTVQLTAVGAPAVLWVESKSIDAIVIRGNADVGVDYQVNGVRRGFEEVEIYAENHNFVPEVRGVPFGTQYPDSYRAILVENGILNPDFTPNEQTAAANGWELRDEVRPNGSLEDSPGAQRARSKRVEPGTAAPAVSVDED